MSMTWSAADIEKLRAAYRSLLCGEAVQTVRFDGPPGRTITYQQSDLKALREELERIDRAAARRPGYTLASTRKGY